MMDRLYVTTTSNSSTTINSESITSINSIPDLLCYYDASGLVINTTNSFGSVDSSGYVSSWNNLAPNYISNTLVQQNSLNQPKLDISGNTQSLFFNGTLSNYFMFTNMFSLYRSTLVLIFKPNTDITSASAGMVLLNSSSAQTIQCYYGFGNLTGNMVGEMNYLYSSNVRGSFTKNGTIYSNKINGISFICNDYVSLIGGRTSDPIFTKGVWTNEIYSKRVKPTEYTMLDVKYFGCINNLSCFVDGRIYEIMIFNRSINDDEQTYIKEYINTKYGI